MHIMENPCWSRCSFPRLTWPALFTNFEGWIFSCLACTAAARGQHVKGGGGQGAQTIQQVQQVPDLQLQPQLVCFVFCSKICCNEQSFSNTAIQSNSRRTQRFHRQTRYDFSESWLALLSKKAHAARRTHNIVLALQLPY